MSTITLYGECVRALGLAKKMLSETQTNKKRFGFVANRAYTALSAFVELHKTTLMSPTRREPVNELSFAIKTVSNAYAEDQKSARCLICSLFFSIDDAVCSVYRVTHRSAHPDYKASDRALDQLNTLPVDQYDLPALQLMLARDV